MSARKRSDITIHCRYGRVPIRADVRGPFAIHRFVERTAEGRAQATRGRLWTLTHVPTGLSIASCVRSRPTAEQIVRSLSCSPFSYAFWERVKTADHLLTPRNRKLSRIARERIERIQRWAQV